MNDYQGFSIKWPSVTHRVDRSRVTRLLPVIEERRPGGLMLARVREIGRHKGLESVEGRRMTLFEGDVVVATLGTRYATSQYEGDAWCRPAEGHILSVGGVCGEVISAHTRMAEPTKLEWIGRLADDSGTPLNLRDFRIRPATPAVARRPETILVVGASMNAGKTTTIAHLARGIYRNGGRVATAKLTGTACRKDPHIMLDAGATEVVDFTECGYPATAGLDTHELNGIVRDLRNVLLGASPDAMIFEIADGVRQRETQLLLADPGFRSLIDHVVFAGPDCMACESGVRTLRELGYRVSAVAGPVSNSVLGLREAEASTGVRCLTLDAMLESDPRLFLSTVRAA